MSELIVSDVLILGCGIAGGTAALKLAEAGLQVTLVTRASQPGDTNTDWAQGGIIFRGRNDSAELLAEDIHNAGAGHCNPRAVQILSEEGPPLVKSILIERLGVQYRETEDERRRRLTALALDSIDHDPAHLAFPGEQPAHANSACQIEQLDRLADRDAGDARVPRHLRRHHDLADAHRLPFQHQPGHAHE